LQLSNLRILRLTLGVACAVFFLFRLSAYAQVPASTDERVIVIVDKIPQAETMAVYRWLEIPAELMKKEGANTPIEALRQVPFVVGTTSTENDSNGGDGSARINLYGLGSQNALTLINGRRAFNFSRYKRDSD